MLLYLQYHSNGIIYCFCSVFLTLEVYLWSETEREPYMTFIWRGKCFLYRLCLKEVGVTDIIHSGVMFVCSYLSDILNLFLEIVPHLDVFRGVVQGFHYQRVSPPRDISMTEDQEVTGSSPGLLHSQQYQADVDQ